MAKQGKCYTCNRVFAWPTDIPMSNAQCPTDKVPLHRCTLSHKGRSTVTPFRVTVSDVERIPSHRRQKTNPILSELAGPGND